MGGRCKFSHDTAVAAVDITAVASEYMPIGRPTAWWIGDTGSGNHLRNKQEMGHDEVAPVF